MPDPRRSRRGRSPWPDRVLRAVRMLGAGIVAGAGQLVVDMPDGYFGATDQLTVTGVVYASSMLGATLACAVAALAGGVWAGWLFAAVIAVGIAFFLPALSSDVVVASLIVAWLLGMLGGELLPRSLRDIGVRRSGDPISPFRPAVVHALLVSTFVTLLVAAFELTSLVVGQLACLVLATVTVGASVVVLWNVSAVRVWFAVSTIGLTMASATADEVSPLVAVLGLVQAGLLGIAMAKGPLFAELLQHFLRRPAVQLMTAFGTTAIGGAVVLTFPAAAEGAPIGALDALFTAVSATCVTGLIVLDTPVAFSAFGEVVILALIQVGALGIMVLSTFSMIILGQRLTIRGEHALEQTLELSVPGKAYQLVRFVVGSTLAIELVGACLLTIAYLNHGLPLDEAVWRGVFHAVSAFCNAGFALQSDSIVMFQSDPLALLVHGALIILGGLGFFVLAWLFRRGIRRRRERAPVQVKVVLWLSGALVLGGTFAYAVLEWNASLASLGVRDKLINALFQSITMRTAGFNSVDLTSVRPATILLTAVFMFIGASPGGTGGGIKTTTFAVLMAALPNIAGSKSRTSLFGRSIPQSTLLRAATIAAVSLSVTVLCLFVLLLGESENFVSLWFETVSALGTVGLSLGATAGLSPVGKSIIIVAMYLGRVGPLTLALALGGGKRPAVEYPETSIMVG